MREDERGEARLGEAEPEASLLLVAPGGLFSSSVAAFCRRFSGAARGGRQTRGGLVRFSQYAGRAVGALSPVGLTRRCSGPVAKW